MYTPNLFPNDIFSLWGKEGSSVHSKLYEPNDRKSHLTSSHHSHNHNNNPNNHNNTNNNQTDNLTNEQLQDQRKYLRSLFAPPLVAYSAEYPGASVSQLEYTIKTQSSGLLNAPLLTPLTQRKLERTRKIRTMGYNTLIPIGIEKTMEQIDYEESRRYALSEQEDQSYIPTAENSATDNQAGSVNGNERDTSMNANGTQNEAREEVDLDGQIMNSDEYQQYSDNFDDDEDDEDDEETIANTRYEVLSDEYQSGGFGNNILNDDDGFMADEVEYQDDHSISNDAGLGQVSNILMNSAATTTTATTTSTISNNVNSSRNLPTANTSAEPISNLNSSRIASIRDCGENDENQNGNENENDDENEYNSPRGSDHSDLDMVIDE